MFLKVGHRGARAYEPENTIRSFARAIKMGVNAVELDVRATKDKKLIVMHDEKLERLTGAPGKVSDYTLRQIKKLKILGKGEIPTLGEALDFIDKKVQKILIEIKEPGTERKVLAQVKRRKLGERVIIVSFHENALRVVRELNKKIETGLIYVKHPNPIKSASQLKVNYLIPLYRFTHTANVERAHKAGLKVIVWTVNTRTEAKQMIKKGVDGIATDKPDIFKGLKF